ncbi:hypothetical protein AK812_SmicGene26448 [Symbiodinium microadriaticum]|uniref:Uncharacterized protein n=1 Tax=Symbiodinium microadriaticum TaxID=2951 RepID=A0A1Q9D9K3_SYMMI|nr:hypothetical protein AK812_SmicGene26448 [Symbiodinium microadriaticum]
MKALEPDRVHIASRLGNGPLAEPAARGREWDAARQVGFLPANELGRRSRRDAAVSAELFKRHIVIVATQLRRLRSQKTDELPTIPQLRDRARKASRQGSLRPDSEPVAQEALGFGIPAASDLRTQRARARHGRTACQLSVYWHDKQPIVWSVFPSSVSAAAPIEVARHTGDIRVVNDIEIIEVVANGLPFGTGRSSSLTPLSSFSPATAGEPQPGAESRPGAAVQAAFCAKRIPSLRARDGRVSSLLGALVLTPPPLCKAGVLLVLGTDRLRLRQALLAAKVNPVALLKLTHNPAPLVEDHLCFSSKMIVRACPGGVGCQPIRCAVAAVRLEHSEAMEPYQPDHAMRGLEQQCNHSLDSSACGDSNPSWPFWKPHDQAVWKAFQADASHGDRPRILPHGKANYGWLPGVKGDENAPDDANGHRRREFVEGGEKCFGGEHGRDDLRCVKSGGLPGGSRGVLPDGGLPSCSRHA